MLFTDKKKKLGVARAKIDLSTVYLKVFHYMMEDEDFRSLNCYPPTLRVALGGYDDKPGGRAAGDYSVTYKFLDSQNMIIPVETIIYIFPERIQYVMEQDMRLQKGQGFYIALGLAVYTLIHEIYHHYDHTIMWHQYNEKAHTGYVKDAEEAYRSFMQFVMIDMENGSLEADVQRRSIEAFKRIWPKVTPWTSDKLTEILVNYIQYSNDDMTDAEFDELLRSIRIFEDLNIINYSFLG